MSFLALPSRYSKRTWKWLSIVSIQALPFVAAISLLHLPRLFECGIIWRMRAKTMLERLSRTRRASVCWEGSLSR